MGKIKDKVIDEMNKEVLENIINTIKRLSETEDEAILLALNHPYCKRFDINKYFIKNSNKTCYNEIDFCNYKKGNKCQYNEFCIYQFNLKYA